MKIYGVCRDRGLASLTHPLLQPKADFVAVLEALYGPEPDPKQWAAAVAFSVSQSILSHRVVGLDVVAHEADYSLPATVLHSSSETSLDAPLERSRDMGFRLEPSVFKALFYPGEPVSTQLEHERRLPEPARGLFATYRAMIDARDVVGVFAYPEPGLILLLWAALSDVHVMRAAERRLLKRVAAHLDSALRLRTQPALVVVGVVAPDGRLLDLDTSAVNEARSSRLATRVVQIDRSRLRARRVAADAIDAWQALLEGRYSLVPREDADGKRYYLVVQNAPAAQVHARLTPREAEVLRSAARGFGGKGIAYNLGLSPAAVSKTLLDAARKLGLRTRAELVTVAGALFGVHPNALDLDALTAAERDVLDLLRRGLSNAEIARLRGRSHHTVANQVSSLLAKTGRPSRLALGAGPDDGSG